MRAMAVLMVMSTSSLFSLSFGQSDIDSLRAAHRLLAEAIASANVDLLVTRVHPEALGFFRRSQYPIQFSRSNSVQDMAPTIVADLSVFATTPLDDVYRIVGDTGVVCSTFSRTPTEGRDKRSRTEFNRATYVYARSGGTWLLVAWHTSSIPLN